MTRPKEEAHNLAIAGLRAIGLVPRLRGGDERAGEDENTVTPFMGPYLILLWGGIGIGVLAVLAFALMVIWNLLILRNIEDFSPEITRAEQAEMLGALRKAAHLPIALLEAGLVALGFGAWVSLLLIFPYLPRFTISAFIERSVFCAVLLFVLFCGAIGFLYYLESAQIVRRKLRDG